MNDKYSVISILEKKLNDNPDLIDTNFDSKILDLFLNISEYDEFRIILRNSNMIINKFISEFNFTLNQHLKIKLGNCLMNLGFDEEIMGSCLPSKIRTSEKVLNSLEIVRYEDLEIDSCCSICMDIFTKTDVAKKLPCGDVFHANCIDKWLKQENRCPNCRFCLTRKKID